jgi:hypothetical protein
MVSVFFLGCLIIRNRIRPQLVCQHSQELPCGFILSSLLCGLLGPLLLGFAVLCFVGCLVFLCFFGFVVFATVLVRGIANYDMLSYLYCPQVDCTIKRNCLPFFAVSRTLYQSKLVLSVPRAQGLRRIHIECYRTQINIPIQGEHE